MDLLAFVLVLAFYGGVVLAVCGLVLASWGLCGIGLVMMAAAIVAIAVVCAADDLCDIAKHNTPVRALVSGLRVAVEAVVCIFLYLVWMPIGSLLDSLAARLKRPECE